MCLSNAGQLHADVAQVLGESLVVGTYLWTVRASDKLRFIRMVHDRGIGG